VKAAYLPEAGDFVWLTFDPQAGREQAERRPSCAIPILGEIERY
jgi:mRNA interferase MazF